MVKGKDKVEGEENQGKTRYGRDVEEHRIALAARVSRLIDRNAKSTNRWFHDFDITRWIGY